jgi:hypothetical protein
MRRTATLSTVPSLRLRAAVALFTVMLLCGCNQLMQAPKDAEKLNNDLHAAMTKGDFKTIYTEADPGLRSAASEGKFVALMTAIQKKLGDPVRSKQTAWNLNATTSGTVLRTQCETTFSKDASGTESIEWRKSDGNYRLYGYHINSDDLISR